jgi:hypothetical protein
VQILEYVWEKSPELSDDRTRRFDTANLAASLAVWRHPVHARCPRIPTRITLGRDGASAIVIGDREASRQHARIERRPDRFVLIDHSSNGTYVLVDNEPEVWVRREEFVLRGRGRIALGRPTADPSVTIVEYFCE